jgi:hypothetical protein
VLVVISFIYFTIHTLYLLHKHNIPLRRLWFLNIHYDANRLQPFFAATGLRHGKVLKAVLSLQENYTVELTFFILYNIISSYKLYTNV